MKKQRYLSYYLVLFAMFAITSVGVLNTEIENIKRGECVVVFFSSTVCPPCRELEVTLRELLASKSYLRVLKIEVNNNLSLAAIYKVKLVPTLFVYTRDDSNHSLQEKKVVGADHEALIRFVTLTSVLSLV